MYSDGVLTNIDIDEDLIAQAMKLTGARSKREAVDRALRDLVARSTRTRVRDLWGIGGIDPDYDPKDPAAHGADVGRWRVEQPVAEYKVKPQPPLDAHPPKPARKAARKR